jgi:hypothetical protein
MISDRNRIYDGWTSLEGGVDAGREPTLLAENQVASAENMTFRGGRAMTRPGFKKLAETFTNPDHSYQSDGLDAGMKAGGINYVVIQGNTAEEVYRKGIFQGAICFSPHEGEDCIVAMIGGRPFKIIPRHNESAVTEIEPIKDEHTPYLKKPPPPPSPLPPGPHPAPGNNNFANATLVSGPKSSLHDPIKGTCVGATVEAGEPLNVLGFTGPVVNTVWYKWTGITDGVREYFNVNQPGYVVEIYTGSTIAGLTFIAGAIMPGPGHPTGIAVQASFIQTAGTLYHIRVRPRGTQFAASFTLKWNDVDPVPPEPFVPANYRNSKKKPIAYMTQADKWLVIQDGESKPILYDGATAVRSKCDETNREKTEVPVGTIMAYGMGRLVVTIAERGIAFGDLYGSHPFEDPGDSLILFTERNFLAEGGDAAIPFTNGRVTGLSFFPQLDTTTGTGQLLAFAERGATSFAINLPRLLWKTSEFQTTALLTTGLRGHRSISVVNEDLWFRSQDGARSYRQARSEPTGWAHIPLSTNVRQFFDIDSEILLKFGSSVYFDNRIIFTTEPAWNQGRPFHNGMAAVDFDIISSFGTKYRPAWEGHWTPGEQKTSNLPNVKVCQVFGGTFNGQERAFFFGMEQVGIDQETNPVYENHLFEFTSSEWDDWDFQHIPWELVSRGFDFKAGQQSTPFNENELYDGDIWLSEIAE